MARYEHLPIHKATYDLNLYFFKLSQNFPKDYKYGIALEIKGLLTEVLDLIIIANSSQDKSPVLQKASLTLERVRFKVRLLKDMKVIKTKSYEFFFRQILEITAQVKKWHDWAREKVRSQAGSSIA